MATVANLMETEVPTAADDLGELVRERREQLGLSQEALAERIGTTRAYVSQIESGTKRWPRSYIPALARELGLSDGDLRRLSPQRSRRSRGLGGPAPHRDAGQEELRERLTSLLARTRLTEERVRGMEGTIREWMEFDREQGGG